MGKHGNGERYSPTIMIIEIKDSDHFAFRFVHNRYEPLLVPMAIEEHVQLAILSSDRNDAVMIDESNKIFIVHAGAFVEALVRVGKEPCFIHRVVELDVEAGWREMREILTFFSYYARKFDLVAIFPIKHKMCHRTGCPRARLRRA